MCWLRTCIRCDGSRINLIYIFSTILYIVHMHHGRCYVEMTQVATTLHVAETFVDPRPKEEGIHDVYMRVYARSGIHIGVYIWENAYQGIMQHIGVEIVLKFHPARCCEFFACICAFLYVFSFLWPTLSRIGFVCESNLSGCIDMMWSAEAEHADWTEEYDY